MQAEPQHLLTILLLVPLLGSFVIAVSPESAARKLAISMSAILCAVFGVLVRFFHPSVTKMQFVEQVPWFSSPFPVEYHVGVDGMSLALVGLTAIVTLLSVLASTNVGAHRPRLYYSMVMLLTTSIMGVFVSLDLLQFFVLWELELAPMYFLIAIWGGPRRDYAAMKFLLYTFFGGIFMLASILFLYFNLGDLGQAKQTFDMIKLQEYCPDLRQGVQLLSALGFFLAFIIKLPSFPFHTWLPDAHVEAPTPISMILAGLLLKMGSYGLVRICLGFFPDFVGQWGPVIMVLGTFNIVWAAIACLAQEDMKRVIALSSVSHMGFILLGLGSLSSAALNGAIFQMVSHGFVSAALFFLVGVLYDRCHTRSIPEIGGGLARQMPFAFYFWMLACLANLGLPALSGFVGEVTVFYGSFTSPMVATHPWVKGWIIFAGLGVIFTAGYMLWLLKRLFYGPEPAKWAGHLTDMVARERLIGYALAVFIIALGVYPIMLTYMYTPVADKLAQEAMAHKAISMR